MQRKRVLIISYYWTPAGGGGVQRWVKFVKYFREFGWEPVVYTVSNGDYPILDPTLAKEVPEGVEVIRTPIWEPYDLYKTITGKKKGEKIDANFLSEGKKWSWKEKIGVFVRGNFFIPDARCFWVKPSVRYLSDYLTQHPVDAIVSTGPPHSCHLIALGVKEEFGLPWIVDYRDQWTQIDFYKELNLTWLADRRHKSLEKKVLDTCDVITPIGKTMAEDLKQISTTRTEVITNGFDESDKADLSLTLDEKFTITYIGTMNNARDPKVLWKALKALKEENHPLINDVEVKLVGKPEASVQQSVQELGIEALVNYVGYVKHAEALRMQNQSQVLLLVINNTWNNKSILTGKIFEYLASNRPILCIGPKDGDAAEIIDNAGSGIVVGYDEVTQVKQQLIAWYNLYLQQQLVATSANISRYSRRTLTCKMASILDELTKK
ncbi:MAG: glycosyltransferase family 4 protein [Chitinophagales bacterium]|nr:glycosyltransferase family 4 protein [Chitinophagales bacterium]